MQYDKSIPTSRFVMQVEEYLLSLQKEEYNAILQFFNEWFSHYGIASVCALSDYKRISIDTITSDKEHNQKIINKYKSNYPNIKSNDVIVFARELLDTINYKLVIRTYDTKYLFIRCK